jgi:hypothetical protein
MIDSLLGPTKTRSRDRSNRLLKHIAYALKRCDSLGHRQFTTSSMINDVESGDVVPRRPHYNIHALPRCGVTKTIGDASVASTYRQEIDASTSTFANTYNGKGLEIL